MPYEFCPGVLGAFGFAMEFTHRAHPRIGRVVDRHQIAIAAAWPPSRVWRAIEAVCPIFLPANGRRPVANVSDGNAGFGHHQAACRPQSGMSPPPGAANFILGLAL